MSKLHMSSKIAIFESFCEQRVVSSSILATAFFLFWKKMFYKRRHEHWITRRWPDFCKRKTTLESLPYIPVQCFNDSFQSFWPYSIIFASQPFQVPFLSSHFLLFSPWRDLNSDSNIFWESIVDIGDSKITISNFTPSISSSRLLYRHNYSHNHVPQMYNWFYL